MKNRNFAMVKAKHIHPSSIIPTGRHDQAIVESVQTTGVQQPLIVRRLASNIDEYELIDGGKRLGALNPEDEVLVDIREANDGQVFRISEATSKRTSRNTRENAAFYAAYLEVVKKEKGEKGALAKVAAETRISESELSQYRAINKLFMKVDVLEPESEFQKLEAMGINKLYKLTELVDSTALLYAAKQIEKKADTLSLEGVNTFVNNLQNVESEQERIVRELGEPVKCTSDELKGDTGFRDLFNDRVGKIAKMKEELSTILHNIETEKLPTRESILNLFEKMIISLRRLTYYGNKLREAQGEECPKKDQEPE